MYDLSDLDNSGFAAPLGASGNPFSPYYSSWQRDWAAGRLFAIPGTPDDRQTGLRLAP